MKSARHTSALVLLALIVSILACSPPKRDYDVEKIGMVDDLEELMYVQATVADRRFKLAKKLDAASVSDTQFAEFEDMGARLEATAKRLPKFSMGKGFNRYTEELAKKSKTLQRAARARNGKETIDTALSIKVTCAACHAEYR